MSSGKFIISMKNPHKCEPTTYYYCSSGKSNTGHTIWDPEPAKARMFSSLETIAAQIEKLRNLDAQRNLDVKDLVVFQKIITYEPINNEQLGEIITKNKIREIIDTLDDTDVDFLVKYANLDLTIVT